jgi:uncharacterized damage-inducible protein DinB
LTEHDRIRDQLKRAHQGEAWHGPSVMEALDGVTVAQSTARPIAGAHSIGELALHIAAWRDIVRRRIAGEKFDVTPADDWPPFAGSPEAWKAALAGLERSHPALLDGLAALPPSRMDQPAVPGGSTCYHQLMGVVQHDVYHAGQISVLKKGA